MNFFSKSIDAVRELGLVDDDMSINSTALDRPAVVDCYGFIRAWQSLGMSGERTVDIAVAGITKAAIHNGLSGLEKLLSINVAVIRVPRVPTQRGQFALDT